MCVYDRPISKDPKGQLCMRVVRVCYLKACVCVGSGDGPKSLWNWFCVLPSGVVVAWWHFICTYVCVCDVVSCLGVCFVFRLSIIIYEDSGTVMVYSSVASPV